MPAVVWAATVAVGALAAAWSVVLPLAEGPDEPSHLGLVLNLADGGGYPDHDGLARSVAVVRLCTTYAAAVRVCPVPGEVVTADAVRTHGVDAAPTRADRPAWNDDGGDRPTAARNQMSQHPPLYYAALAADPPLREDLCDKAELQSWSRQAGPLGPDQVYHGEGDALRRVSLVDLWLRAPSLL